MLLRGNIFERQNSRRAAENVKPLPHAHTHIRSTFAVVSSLLHVSKDLNSKASIQFRLARIKPRVPNL